MNCGSGSDERGIILLMTLVVLLLISAIAAAILYISSTESSLVAYQRGAMTAYDAGRAGLEEARARFSTPDPMFLGNWQTGLVEFPNPEVDNAGNGLGIGQVLYILNPAPGEAVEPWTAGSPYYDWEFGDEFGYEISTVGQCSSNPIPAPPDPPPAPLTVARCRWQVYSDQSDLSGSNFSVPAPQAPFKWVRITLVTEQVLNRDIDGSGALDNTIPVFWKRERGSGGSLMNIDLDLLTLDLDKDGHVSFNERLGRTVYRVTSMAEARTGGKQIVQYDVSGVKLTMDFPGAISLIGVGSSCGSSQGGTDPNVEWGPSGATRVNGNDQAPSNGRGARPAIAGDDFLTADDCLQELQSPRDLTGNWTGSSTTGTIGDPSNPAPATRDLTTTEDFENIINNITEMADQVISAPDPPPYSDSLDANNDVEASGTALSTVDFGECSNDFKVRQPKITVLNGDAKLKGIDGCGILLITGDAYITGALDWKGMVLVIGNGRLEISGGGNSSIDGALLMARIYCGNDNRPTSQCAGPNPKPALTEPRNSQLLFAGGGTMNVNYNSFWINGAFNSVTQQIVSYREIGQID